MSDIVSRPLSKEGEETWDRVFRKRFCNICKRELDNPFDKTTKDCGGDCLRCMAEAGDPDCIRRMGSLYDHQKIDIKNDKCSVYARKGLGKVR